MTLWYKGYIISYIGSIEQDTTFEGLGYKVILVYDACKVDVSYHKMQNFHPAFSPHCDVIFVKLLDMGVKKNSTESWTIDS